jgi:adenylate cyclase
MRTSGGKRLSAREQRRLAAIVAADVVGYSRLIGRDEAGTVARLHKNRSEHLDPILRKYGGRLVKLTGDGALIEFASAVDALSAAVEFQQAIAEANSDQPADGSLVFRMGLHLGDLIVDGDDLYGDGRKWRPGSKALTNSSVPRSASATPCSRRSSWRSRRARCAS